MKVFQVDTEGEGNIAEVGEPIDLEGETFTVASD